MPIYTAVIQGDTGVSAAAGGSDQFFLQAPATIRNRIREIRIGQFSDFGDPATTAEILGVRVIRYRTTDTGGEPSGGVAVVPRNIHGWADTGGYSSIVSRSHDVLATDTGVAGNVTEVLISDAFNIAAGWWYYPPEEEMIILDFSDRLVVRMSKAADVLTMNGTLVFEEMVGPI